MCSGADEAQLQEHVRSQVQLGNETPNALKRGLFVPRVLAIREPSPGQFSAQIQTQGVGRWYKWYKPGESFERYRLVEIAPESREAALLIEPGNFVLRIKAEE